MKQLYILSLLFIQFPDPAFTQNPLERAGQWTIVAAYNSTNYIAGMTWDGNNIFTFNGGFLSSLTEVTKFNPSDSSFTNVCVVPAYYQVGFHGPQVWVSGLTYKSPNFVTIQKEMTFYYYPAVATEFDTSGNLGAIHTCPDPYLDQICWDTDHFWGCEDGAHGFFKFDESGNVISIIDSITVPVGNMCTQGPYLWFVSPNDSIYKIDQNGSILERHPAFGSPRSVIFDGSYLWYCGYYWDGQALNSKIIKIDLNGPGSPYFQIDSLKHDYGLTLLQDSSVWKCTIRNPGSAPLIIDQITFPPAMPFSADVILPLTINAGDSLIVNFTFLPVLAGRFDINVFLHSNDIIFPNKTINLTGIGAYSGAHIEITVPNYSYGNRRLKSTTLWKAHLVNNGTQTLSINSITSNNPAFFVDRPITFPVDVQSLDTIDVWIWFQPRENKPYSGILSISSNSITQNPYTTNMTGNGTDSVYPLFSRLWDYTFTPLYGYETPSAILPIGDISGDSIPDIVVSLETGQTVCLNGNASGKADVLWAESFGNCRDQHGIALIPDIDNDSTNDVIIALYYSEAICALSGKTGNVIWSDTVNGGFPEQIDVTYDYNDDGFPDVLVALSYSTINCQRNNSTVYCLNGRTGSVIWKRTTSFCAYAVKGVPDFTGDGKPDVIAGIREFDEEGTNPKIYGLDGIDGHIVYSTTGCSADFFLVIEDMTGDGIPDIASANKYYPSGADFSLIDIKTGITQCDVGEGSSVFPLDLMDMGVVPGDTVRGIFSSGCEYIGISFPPECYPSWEFRANVATNAGDLDGDSVNDIFFAAYTSSHISDTIGYLNGRNGHLFKKIVFEHGVTVAQPFIDLTGKGYHTVIIGGTGYLSCLAGAHVSTIGFGEIAANKDHKPALQVFPNPATEIVHIRIDMPEKSFTRLDVYDSRGLLIESLLMEELPAGIHDLTWNIRQLNLSGLYLLKLQTEGKQETVKLLVPQSK